MKGPKGVRISGRGRPAFYLIAQQPQYISVGAVRQIIPLLESFPFKPSDKRCASRLLDFMPIMKWSGCYCLWHLSIFLSSGHHEISIANLGTSLLYFISAVNLSSVACSAVCSRPRTSVGVLPALGPRVVTRRPRMHTTLCRARGSM